ncbi:MAG: hypothetical protein IJJ26_04825 [Victivallales bacterium]|nr:hypothetical protein [Victivallales bacterium]
MELKQLLIGSVVLNVALLATSAFFYLDSNSSKEVAQSLATEREEAIAKVTELEEKNKTLSQRLALSQQNTSSEDADAVARLKQALDEKDAEITRLKATANSGNRRGDRDRDRGPNRENMQERMERFREENPELYARMQNQREEFQKRMEEHAAKRDNYVNNIDTSRLSVQQRRTVSDYQALLKTQEELRQTMQNGNGDRDSWRQMFENQRQISQMSGDIRNILLEQYASTISSSNSAAVATEIQNIIDATSNFGGGGGFGGGQGGRGPGGGRGGRGNRNRGQE